jgi:dCTP deaminase
MILSDDEILDAIAATEIKIEPFNRECLGSNSYDVHLSQLLLTYKLKLDQWYNPLPIDPAEADPAMVEHLIGPEGFVLRPGVLYLGSTVEYTETHVHVPYLDGTSSVGRLGISIHATAGRGDVGFRNHWTMEISCIQPVRIYAGMPIGQLTYHTVKGEVLRDYASKSNSTYGKLARNPRPQPSRMWTKLGKLVTQ